jgi:transposase
MSVGRDQLSRSQTLAVAAIENGVPLLVEARELIASFQGMIRKRAVTELGAWLARARSSLLASFARGVLKEEAAATAALNLPWFNGHTEGQITRLKLVKRQMYGRGRIDMLQARLTCGA